jgi:hypothetical protein
MNFSSGPRRKMCAVCGEWIDVMDDKSECERFMSKFFWMRDFKILHVGGCALDREFLELKNLIYKFWNAKSVGFFQCLTICFPGI